MRALRLRQFAAVAVLLCTAIAAHGFATAEARTAKAAVVAPPAQVYVQGDSLTVDSASSLRTLAKPSVLAIDAKTGRHAYQGAALMAKVKILPENVVIGLGSNDDYDAMGVAIFRANVGKIMSLVGKSRCAVWVNMYQKPTAAQVKKKIPMIFTGLNNVLKAMAASNTNVRIVDWASLAAANPSWFRYDSMHPTVAGYLARSKATVAALKTCSSTPVVDPPETGGGGGTPPPS